LNSKRQDPEDEYKTKMYQSKRIYVTNRRTHVSDKECGTDLDFP